MKTVILDITYSLACEVEVPDEVFEVGGNDLDAFIHEQQTAINKRLMDACFLSHRPMNPLPDGASFERVCATALDQDGNEVYDADF